MDTINLKQLGDSFFNIDFERFIDSQPYMSFVVMAGIIEFMGKCIQKRSDFHKSGHSEKDFSSVFEIVTSLNKYQKLNKNDKAKSSKDKDCNYLYKAVRCGMVHAFIPKENIYLSDKDNDLSNSIVGAKELYSDLKNAWKEICMRTDVKDYLSKKEAIQIQGNVSGSTRQDTTVYSQD